jgi:hypothetical protein
MSGNIGRFSKNITSSDDEKSPSDIDNSNTYESYIIEGIPFVSEETQSRCPIITATMIFQYYGINTTVSEVFHHSGGGYSFAYQKIYPLRLWSGYMIPSGPENRRFIADLYGLSHDYWYTYSKERSEECWNKYWTLIKQNITRNIPVVTITNVNDLLNIPSQYYYTDSILIVGFNEENQTICCHIPYHGPYMYLSLETFKDAVYQLYICKIFYRTIYYIETFENITKPPLSKKECFQKAHKRNIERMKGNKSAYDQDFRKLTGLRIFGMNALKNLKKDYNFLNFLIYNLLPESHPLVPWTSIGSYWMIYEEKYEISQYLSKNQNLSKEVCLWDSQHLELESYLILHLAHLIVTLNQTIYNNELLKAIILTRPIIIDIKSTIDTIISIEEAIIEGPPIENYS